MTASSDALYHDGQASDISSHWSFQSSSSLSSESYMSDPTKTRSLWVVFWVVFFRWSMRVFASFFVFVAPNATQFFHHRLITPAVAGLSSLVATGAVKALQVSLVFSAVLRQPTSHLGLQLPGVFLVGVSIFVEGEKTWPASSTGHWWQRETTHNSCNTKLVTSLWPQTC